MSYSQRYKNLNHNQQLAVDTIDGPVFVIAGPGTGKTELLSMRAASILQKTDTTPESILCLTFTESGAHSMRKRMAEIFGAAAYKIPIHTFHSFGSEIINQYGEYFYHGANFQPADALTNHKLLVSLFESLPHGSPIASKMNGEYTYLRDAQTAISELKRGGIAPNELRKILLANQTALDVAEHSLAAIFSNRISKSTAAQLQTVALLLAQLETPSELPVSITPLANVISISLAQAIDHAESDGSTKPITAWKNKWLDKDTQGSFVFKDRARTEKLFALATLYEAYSSTMDASSRYDFDDMILRVTHAMEHHDDLRFSLQERYLYIMVDEFQDTNQAQMRLLNNLTSNGIDDSPNLMIVGDDDQAIYSFQGAELSNISQFIQRYETAKRIVLTDNYRSSETILSAAQQVIRNVDNRLELSLHLDKTLVPHNAPSTTFVSLQSYANAGSELHGIAVSIAERIATGTPPSDIAIIARYHYELIEMLDYLHEQGIHVSYERRDNVLESPVIKTLLLLARVITSLGENQLQEVDALLPELLAQPALALSPEIVWKLSLNAYKNRSLWIEEMPLHPELLPLHTWLLEESKQSLSLPLEQMIDRLVGSSDQPNIASLYGYFFSEKNQLKQPEAYLDYLGALRTIRHKLKEYQPDEQLLLRDFVDYIALTKAANQTITNTTKPTTNDQAINLLTAHKAKGLEFKHVYITGAVDTTWGERVRTRTRLIRFPENLTLSPAGDTIDERIRLFFVAMTRAMETLTISYSKQKTDGRSLLPASFLESIEVDTVEEAVRQDIDEAILQSSLDWRGSLLDVPQQTMHELLVSQLDNYKLSATHLGNFLDISRGGPQYFLVNNLLRFPQSMSPDATFGSAIHASLQRAHSFFVSNTADMPLEDIYTEFTTQLQRARLSETDETKLQARGIATLKAFMASPYATFKKTQKAELSFANQHSIVGDAHLTGILDVADIDMAAKTISVIDYKTGKPSESWSGKTDYEKIKLHKYRQQLLFYELLIKHSRDFSKFTIAGGYLQFVEPTKTGAVTSPLSLTFTEEELATFSTLINKVWRAITTMTLPDASHYSPDYKGMLDFERDLLDS